MCKFLVAGLPFKWFADWALIGGGENAGLYSVRLNYSANFINYNTSAPFLWDRLSSIFVFHLFLVEVTETISKTGIVFLEDSAKEFWISLLDDVI